MSEDFRDWSFASSTEGGVLESTVTGDKKLAKNFAPQTK